MHYNMYQSIKKQHKQLFRRLFIKYLFCKTRKTLAVSVHNVIEIDSNNERTKIDANVAIFMIDDDFKISENF